MGRVALKAPAVRWERFWSKASALCKHVCLFLCILCIFLALFISLSLKHYGEKILSLFNMREMGSVSCWTRREERKKPSWLHLTAFSANALCSSFLVQRTQSPTSQWLVPLLPHSLGLNILLLDMLILQVQARHPSPGRVWHQGGVKSSSRTEAWRGPGQR